MKYRISVTQEDIDKGIMEDVHSCPIAIACSRKLKRPVAVGHNGIGPKNYSIVIPHTRQTRNFSIDFDNGEVVNPFTFDLELEPQYELHLK